MQVNSIFLNPKSLEETGGCYGIVTASTGTVNIQQSFPEQYLNKFMLVQALQEKLNYAAEAMADLPEEADRTTATVESRVLKSIYEEVKQL